MCNIQRVVQAGVRVQGVVGARGGGDVRGGARRPPRHGQPRPLRARAGPARRAARRYLTRVS